MKKVIKRIMEFSFIIILSIALSSCTFFYKEKAVEKKEVKENKENKNINLEEESKIREEELNKRIETIVNNEESNKDTSQKNNTQKESVNKEKEIINKYKTELYNIKAQYNGEIHSAIGQAKEEYTSLPDDQKTTMTKVKIGLKYIKNISSLEKECDKKVYAVLDNMENELKSNGYNIETVEIIKNYYEEEKDARKSYYMSKLK